jgi:hypothetical protein
MRTYDFILNINFEQADGTPLVLDGEAFLDLVEDHLFKAFRGAVTPSVSGSEARIHCHVSAANVEAAVTQVATVLSLLGLGPGTLEMPVEELLSGHAYA